MVWFTKVQMRFISHGLQFYIVNGHVSSFNGIIKLCISLHVFADILRKKVLHRNCHNQFYLKCTSNSLEGSESLQVILLD